MVEATSLEDVIRIVAEVAGETADRPENEASQSWIKTQHILDRAAKRAIGL